MSAETCRDAFHDRYPQGGLSMLHEDDGFGEFAWDGMLESLTREEGNKKVKKS